MKQVRHISFDVWNTLIKGNPAFQQLRTAALVELFPVDLERATRAYEETKSYLDNLAEEKGHAFDSEGVYCELIRRLMDGCELEADWYGLWEETRRVTEQLFRENPPLVLDSTRDTVRRLHDAGYTISIGSNTNFVSGTVLSEVIDALGVPFEFKVFSDLDGYAKPHSEFFNLILDKARAVRTAQQPEGRADLARSQILHVGDNLVCDGDGAMSASMDFFYVKNPTDIPTILQAMGE